MSAQLLQERKLEVGLRMINASITELIGLQVMHPYSHGKYQEGQDVVLVDWEVDGIRLSFLIDEVKTTLHFRPDVHGKIYIDSLNLTYTGEQWRDVGRLLSFWYDATEFFIDQHYEKAQA
jgi:hypothetical protein